MKYLDIFGITFNFTTDKSVEFQSSFGGFVTICCTVLTIIFSILFGKDFIDKKNPKVYQQNIFPKTYLDPVLLDADNFVFAWRFMDKNAFNIDLNGKIFPLIYHERMVTNSSGVFIISHTPLELTKCNTTNSKMLEFNENFDISKYNCFDWSKGNFTIGGYFDGPYADYFRIELSLCPNKNYYTPNGNCTSIQEYKNILINPKMFFFELIYPEFYFLPEDINHPLRINFKSFFFNFSPNIARIDRSYLTLNYLIDDLGWILENKKTIDKYSVQEIKTDLTFIDFNELGRDYTQSVFYALCFYMNKSYIQYNRSFMKIQDLAALVGGFMKGILFVGSFITRFYNLIKRNNFIYNQFFEFPNPYEELSQINGVNEKTSSFYKNKNYPVQSNNYSNTKNSNIQSFSPPSENITHQLSFRKFVKINSYELNLIRKKKNKYNFGLDFIFKKSLGLQKNQIHLKVFNYVEKFFNERFDIIFYLKHLYKFDQMKKIIFEGDQSLVFNFMKPPCLKEDKLSGEIHSYSRGITKENLNHVINYFKNKISTNTMNETDFKLLDLVHNEIKEECYKI